MRFSGQALILTSVAVRSFNANTAAAKQISSQRGRHDPEGMAVGTDCQPRIPEFNSTFNVSSLYSDNGSRLKREPDFSFFVFENTTGGEVFMEIDEPGHRSLAPLSQSDEFIISAACEVHSSVLGLGSAGGYACETITKFAVKPVINWLSGLFGDTDADDAWVTITNSDTVNAEGDALEITWHRANGESDKDSLGYLSRGETETWREDLDASALTDIELRIDETNDVCIRNFAFTVGREPSGTGRVEMIDIPAWVVGDITQTILRPDCIWFGDHEGSVANFKFHWPTALSCYKKFFVRQDKVFYTCMTYAMRSYDKVVNGKIRRWSFGSLTPPPSNLGQQSTISGYQQYRNHLPGNFCMDLKGARTHNGNPVQLYKCNGTPAQHWRIDSEGRIHSKVDPGKCIDAGKYGNLYDTLFIYDCNNGLHQKWTRHGSGRIMNKSSRRYIGVAWCANENERQLELRNYEDGTCGTAMKWSW